MCFIIIIIVKKSCAHFFCPVSVCGLDSPLLTGTLDVDVRASVHDRLRQKPPLEKGVVGPTCGQHPLQVM